MNPSQTETTPDKNAVATPSESGALAAWGLILGATLGCIVGLFFRQWMSLAAAGGALGWSAGALIERLRR